MKFILHSNTIICHLENEVERARIAFLHFQSDVLFSRESEMHLLIMAILSTLEPCNVLTSGWKEIKSGRPDILIYLPPPTEKYAGRAHERLNYLKCLLWTTMFENHFKNNEKSNSFVFTAVILQNILLTSFNIELKRIKGQPKSKGNAWLSLNNCPEGWQKVWKH